MTGLTESAALARASGRTIPNFFIVGHAKCGTTALYEMLRRHPEIFMSEFKEPWFFSRDNPQPQSTPERSVAFTGRRAETLDEYLALFDDANSQKRVGEGSTSYLWSESAAGRIAEVQPGAKIIAVLREPASFLRSLHLQLLQNHHEAEEDFAKAVSLDQPRREGREIPSYSYWPQALIYSDRVRYAEQLRRYHAAFPPEQVLVLIYDDFRAHNEQTVRRVFEFLEVDATHHVEAIRTNPTIGTSVRRDNLRRTLKSGRDPLSRAVRGGGRTLTSRQFRRRVVYPLQRRFVFGEPPAPDEQFMTELRRRFKPQVEAASEYLKRDLVALWGYDRLG